MSYWFTVKGICHKDNIFRCFGNSNNGSYESIVSVVNDIAFSDEHKIFIKTRDKCYKVEICIDADMVEIREKFKDSTIFNQEITSQLFEYHNYVPSTVWMLMCSQIMRKL
jgi:hypothetical protein